MKVHTRTVIDIASGEVLEDDSYEYTGPIASCDPVTATIGAIGGSAVSGWLGAEASEDASHAASQSAANSVAEQRRQFDLTRGDTAPYRETGQNALSQLAQLFGLPGRTSSPGAIPLSDDERSQYQNIRTQLVDPNTGSMYTGNAYEGPQFDQLRQRYDELGARSNIAPAAQTPTASTPQSILESMPGYRFRLGEQEKAMERMQAARGYSMTPRAAKEVGRYASDYASGEFGNLVESLFRLSGLGGNAVNTSASAGANAAGNIGNAYMNAGNAQANAAMNSGAAWNNAIQGGLNNATTIQMYNRMLPRYTPANYGPMTDPGYSMGM